MGTLALAIDARRARQGAEEFVRQGTDRVKRGAREAKDSVGRLDTSLDRMGRTSRSVGRAVSGLFASLSAAVALSSATRTMADFEQTMSTVQAVTGASAAEFQVLEDTARRLGATTRFSATEAGEGLVFLSRAGFEANDAVASLPATLDLAAAGALGLGEAADIASNVLSQFGLQAAETSRVADILVNTANSANTDVRQLAEALKLVGPVAGALNISLEETAAAVGVLGDSGIQASLAGTNLRGVISGLLGPTTAARKAIQGLGLSLDEVNPESNGILDIFRRFSDANLSAADAVTIFGRRNAAAALILRDATGKLADLTEENGNLDELARQTARTMSDNLAGSFKSLTSAISEAALGIGDSGLRGALRSVVDTTASAIRILAGMSTEADRANAAGQALATTLRITGVALASLAAAQVGLFFGRLAVAVATTVTSFQALRAAMAAHPVLFLAGVIGSIATAMGILSTDVAEADRTLDQFGRTASQVAQEIGAMADAQRRFNLAVRTGDTQRQISARINQENLILRETERLQKLIETTPKQGFGIPPLIDLQSLQRRFPGTEFPDDIRTRTLSGELLGKVTAPGAIDALLKQAQAIKAQRVELQASLKIKREETRATDQLREATQKLREHLKGVSADQIGHSKASNAARDALDEVFAALLEEKKLLADESKSLEVVNGEIERNAFIRRVQTEALRGFGDLADVHVKTLVRMFDESRKLRREKEAEEKARRDASAQLEREKAIRDSATRSLQDLVENLRFETTLINKTSEGRRQAIELRRFDALAAQAQVDNLAQLRGEFLANLNATAQLESGTRSYVGTLEETNVAIQSVSETLADGFGEAAKSILFHFDTIESAARNLVTRLSETFFDLFVTRNLSGFLSGLFGTSSGAFGSTTTGPGGVPFVSVGNQSVPEFNAASAILANANGNIFRNGAVVPFESGGITTGPEFFPLRDGRVGLRGEAGPEAIVPLPDGRRIPVELRGNNEDVVREIRGLRRSLSKRRRARGFGRSRRQQADDMIRSLEGHI